MDHKELDVTERLSTPAHELPNLPDECGRRGSPKALPLQSYHWYLSPVSYEWQFPNGFPSTSQRSGTHPLSCHPLLGSFLSFFFSIIIIIFGHTTWRKGS